MSHVLGRALVIGLALASLASAQEIRATIYGRVIDESGSSVPAAKVRIVNRATNVGTEVATNLEGNYVVAFLTPGEYSVSVEKQGFSRAVRDSILLQTLERLGVDFTLKPGSVTESVTVVAESPMIQTASAEFGQVVNSRFVTRLPGVGANPLGLADTAPGVIPNNPDGNLTTYTTSWVQFNGSTAQGNQQPGTGNQMTIDGAPAEVPRMSGVSYVIPMAEMLGEMKVVTAMFDAAQGRTNGGAILITTKSGANQFHGSAYYHFRDERFNANSWSNKYVRRARGQQNYWMMGGTLNGPIRKDQTFFSVGMEKERNLGTSNYNFRVPTALERQGDFSQTLNSLSQPLTLYDPLTTVMDARGNFVSREPFPGARLPAARVNPVGSALVNQYPDPNYLVFPNLLTQVNYLTSVTPANPNLNLQSRVDHVLNNNHRLYFRFARNHGLVSKYDHPIVAGYAGVSGSQQGNTDDRLGHQFTLEETATLRPTLVASFRLGFNRFIQKTSGDGDDLDPDALKLTPALKQLLYSGKDTGRGWPRLEFNDGPIPWVGPLYRQSVNNILTFTSGWNKFWGSHNLRWGSDYRNTRWNEDNPGSAMNGRFVFDKNLTRATDVATSGNTSGSGLASLMLGLPTSGSLARTAARAAQSHYSGFYLQDDYRILPRLTLSLGLRYDFETPFTERYDTMAYDFQPDADLGITVPGIGPLKGGLRFVGVGGLPRRQGQIDRNNFGPRIGMAYTIGRKTVVRAGWGLFYEGLTNNLSSSTDSGTPSSLQVSTFNANTSYIGSSDGYRTVLPGVNLSNPFPNGFNPITGNSLGLLSLLGSGVNFYKPDRQLPSVHQIQVTVQRSLPWTSVVEVAYVGARYNGMYQEYALNEVPDAYRTQDNSTANPFYGILPPSSSRGSGANITANALKVRFPQFSSVTQALTNGPWGRYHGLQTRWEKRFSHGLQFVANYTWAKNIYFDPQSLVNDRFYKYVNPFDYTHVARLFFTADAPFGRHQRWGAGWPRWLDAIGGGWAMTWVVRYRSGPALGLSGPIGRPIPLANPVTGAGIHACLGAVTGALPPSPCLDIGKIQPLTGKYDITPEPPYYSWLRGPGYAEHDAVFFKTVRIAERVGFELRAEVHNLPNTPQWGNPATDISNPRTFGQISGGGNPRTVRFTGRLRF